MYFELKIFSILGVFGFVVSLDLKLDKCRLEDSECMLAAFQHAVPLFADGIPELGVDAMDPMVLDDEVTFNLTGLSFSFSNAHMEGLKDIIIKNIKWDVGKKVVDLEYVAPLYFATGKYKANGKILLLPITGDGEMRLRLRNLKINVDIFYEEKKKNGLTFIFVKSYKYVFNVEGDAHYDLTNLFNGNEQLSTATLTFLNDNWKEVTNEFGGPIIDAISKKIFKNVNTFMSKSPMEELSLSY